MKASRPYHRHAAREILDALQGPGTAVERVKAAQAISKCWDQRLNRAYRPVGKTAEGMEEWSELTVALGIGKNAAHQGKMWFHIPGLEYGAFILVEDGMQYLLQSAEECLGIRLPRRARERWLESVRFGTECVVRRLVASKADPESIRDNIEGLRRSAAADKLAQAPSWDNKAHEYVAMADDFIQRWEAGEYDVTP